MIDWGNTPAGSLASIYIPSVSADQILDMASRLYTTRRLVRGDDHTIRCKTGGITYVPIPHGTTMDYPGLLSIDLPGQLRPGARFDVVVRQVTNAFSAVRQPLRGMETTPAKQSAKGKKADALAVAVPRPHQWRRVHGAFQLTMVVHADKPRLLLNEERLLSVMKWVGNAIPAQSRWSPVFERYLQDLGGRVQTFGGDPGQILPSPTGHGSKPAPCGNVRTIEEITGKISKLVFDHFGDFDGFVLETTHGEHRFFSREVEIKHLAERAWRERLRITVHREIGHPHRPTSIVVHPMPALF
jgi:hypothetical protein